jgi:hypothetical protein
MSRRILIQSKLEYDRFMEERALHPQDYDGAIVIFQGDCDLEERQEAKRVLLMRKLHRLQGYPPSLRNDDDKAELSSVLKELATMDGKTNGQ